MLSSYCNLISSLQVILVELEEISPAQLALFPESVRHLRKKQGAVCWWKNQRQRQRWRTCLREAQDEEKCEENKQRLSPSLSPSSRFWKEMRYHMPVRGKRVVYPEKTALLNLKWGRHIHIHDAYNVNWWISLVRDRGKFIFRDSCLVQTKISCPGGQRWKGAKKCKCAKWAYSVDM